MSKGKLVLLLVLVALAVTIKPTMLPVILLPAFLLVRLNRQDHVLMLSMHHIVSDGWSMGVMIREIGALYKAFAAG